MLCARHIWEKYISPSTLLPYSCIIVKIAVVSSMSHRASLTTARGIHLWNCLNVVCMECIILYSSGNKITIISPTDHEEADSRMMLHLQHAVMAGHKVAFVRTVDSDVVVLSIHHYPTFQNLGLTGLWIGFGCGKNYRDTPVHEVSAQLGPNRCLALPCIQWGWFDNKTIWDSEKTAWNAWLHCPEVTEKPWSP